MASKDDDERGAEDRIGAMSEDEVTEYLYRSDLMVLEAMIGALQFRWGKERAVAMLHDELADLEVHG